MRQYARSGKKEHDNGEVFGARLFVTGWCVLKCELGNWELPEQDRA